MKTGFSFDETRNEPSLNMDREVFAFVYVHAKRRHKAKHVHRQLSLSLTSLFSVVIYLGFVFADWRRVTSSL